MPFIPCSSFRPYPIHSEQTAQCVVSVRHNTCVRATQKALDGRVEKKIALALKSFDTNILRGTKQAGWSDEQMQACIDDINAVIAAGE